MKTVFRIFFVILVLFVTASFITTSSFAARVPAHRGQWSAPQPITRSALTVFESVVGGRIDGILYVPTAHSYQIVNGKRYRFYCRSSVLDSPKTGSALITVFVHLGGKTELVSIEDATLQSANRSIRKSSARPLMAEPLYPRTGPYLQAPRKTAESSQQCLPEITS